MPKMSQDTSASDAALAFGRALAAARDEMPGNGSLWRGLLASSGWSEHQLAEHLREKQGVEVVTDEQWAMGTRVLPVLSDASAPVVAVRIIVGSRNLLLCEDPWTPEALAIFAQPGPASLQLALARPGQIAALPLLSTLSPLGVRTAGSEVADRRTPTGSASSPVVAYVDQAISLAYDEGASDIHFETDRRGVGLRFRLDGVMSEGPRLDDPARAEEVISRIKVLASLNITERRRPQDGRIHWIGRGNRAIDLRVSVMPSIFGEDAVLRLLDKAQLRRDADSMSLDGLGFDPVTAKKLRDLATRPHGMLLITGPTGSGKTTTVYAAMSEVNDGIEKIITIEDPVEYELPGVLQIPVNEQKGLTFATGLRSILRHDPDKILVGEIRDAETGEIAVQSALTGHLVFTTVHANSLFDVLGRFQHFGIEAFALASALNGVVVQRLLRKLCKSCASEREATPEEQQRLSSLEVDIHARLPHAVGCPQCRQTGYRGRFVVAEVHTLDDRMRDLIVQRPSMAELKAQFYSTGNRQLRLLAVDRVREGLTTLEEVARVVGFV